MNCSTEISRIVCRILELGILDSRCAAWEGNAERAALFADHIHNLPSLLSEFSHEKLKFYWDVERPAFIDSVGEQISGAYAELWQELDPHVVDSAQESVILTHPER